MFDIGWMELMLIGIVALIVIGPKDLPQMFRQLGRITAKLRSMAREFSRAMEDAAKESGVQDVAKDINSLANPRSAGVDALKSAADKFEKWDPVKNVAKPSAPLTSETIRGPVLPPNSIPPSPKPAAPATPAAATGAAAETPAAAAAPASPAATAPVGPNTAALYEKQAARQKVLRETAERLKAIDSAAPAATATAAAAPAAPAAAAPAQKPRAPRKKKSESETPAT